jgi:hypothetical protein
MVGQFKLGYDRIGQVMNWRLEHIIAAIALPSIIIGLALAVAGFRPGLWICIFGIGVSFLPLVGAIFVLVIERLRH